MIPDCPSLPPAIRAVLQHLRHDLESVGLLRKIDPLKAAAWDQIVDQWAASDLPLIVRRGGHSQMCMRLPHRTGRMLAPSDNSPAHWLVIQCFTGVAPSLDYIRREFERIPMTMRMSKKEAATCDFQMRLDDLAHAGLSGWYLAHIEDVGLGRVGPIEEAPIETLQAHFRRLMRPSNMLLISRELSGLAEIDTFIV